MTKAALKSCLGFAIAFGFCWLVVMTTPVIAYAQMNKPFTSFSDAFHNLTGSHEVALDARAGMVVRTGYDSITGAVRGICINMPSL